MKKLLILLSIIFLLGFSHTFDWYSYVGKNVRVCVFSYYYIGRVDEVFEISICKQQEPLTGVCIDLKEYYTLILRQPSGKIIVIRCEAISDIQEIK